MDLRRTYLVPVQYQDVNELSLKIYVYRFVPMQPLNLSNITLISFEDIKIILSYNLFGRHLYY